MRKLIIALMVLIIVVAALLGWALYNIDSVVASYKARIIAAAERRTGRKVDYDRVHVKLRGGISVRIRGLSITEDPAFGSGHFLQAADVQVNLGIHLLRREVSVSRVVLQRPVLQVIRNPRGVYNFTGLGSRATAEPRAAAPQGPLAAPQTTRAPAEQTPPARQPTADETPGFGVDLAVAHLEVSGGTLDYRDEKDRRHVQLKELDLRVDDLRTDRPFKTTLATGFLEDRQNVRFDGLIGPMVPGAQADAVPVDGKVDITTLSWDALRRAFPGMNASWPEALDLTGTLQTQGFSLKGALKDLAVSGTLDLTHTALKYGDAVSKPRGTALRLAVDARVTPESIAAKRFEVTLHKVNVKGEGDVELGSPTTLDLSLDMAATDMTGWERWMPLLAGYRLSGRAAAKAEITGKLGAGAVPGIEGTVTLREAGVKLPALQAPLEEVSAAVEFSNHGATFHQLSFGIGQARLAGKAVLENLAPLTVTYRLASPTLRFADLGLQPDDAVLENARSSGRLTWPGGLSFAGTLTSTRGTLLGRDFADLTARLGVTEDRLAVEAFRLKTLGGTVNANGGMQLQGAPRFDVAARLNGIDIRQYFAGVAGAPEVTGTLNADLSVTGQGRTWDAVKTTLAGKGAAAVVEGRLLDVNLAEQALQGITGLQGLTSLFSRRIKDKYPQIFNRETTVFEQLDTEIEAVDGRIVVTRATLKARDYHIAGKGSIKLDGVTDLDGVLTLSEDLSSDLLPGSRLTPITNEKGQVEVPFTITGTMPDVRLRPRLKLIESLLEKTIGRGVQGVLELIPGGDARPTEKSGKEPQEAPAAKDPVQQLIERALKLFGGGR